MSPPLVAIAGCIVLLACFQLGFRLVRAEYRKSQRPSDLAVNVQVGLFILQFSYVDVAPFHAFLRAGEGFSGNWVGRYFQLYWPALTGNLALQLAGSLCAVAGIALFAASCFLQLGVKRSVGRDFRIEQSGLYRWTRNPQYLGYALGLAALPLLFPSWYMALWWATLVPMLRGMAALEEWHLEAVLGDAYRAYLARTPRFLPFPPLRRAGPASSSRE
jgi:protein-S-isoprenylcysteine O-methyltransferase Ste14